jgi:hypothetical protein
MFGGDNVKTDEPKFAIVGNGRDTTHRLIFVEQTNEEAVRVRPIEAFRIVQPRIPSFLCSELNGEIHLTPFHRSNGKLEILVSHLKDYSSKMPTSSAKREVTIPTGASKISFQFTKLAHPSSTVRQIGRYSVYRRLYGHQLSTANQEE